MNAMQVNIKAGNYIVAVSGGVDSVLLLHLLVKQKQGTVNSGQSSGTDHSPQIPENSSHSSKHTTQSSLIVAHFDHGIRPDSEADRLFVEKLARSYGLPFEYKREELGENASEALARERRYAFLEEVRQKYHADAIITAHHADDVLETACINLLRGTGRKGIASLQNKSTILRPLLGFSKLQIIEEATRHKLKWREDETNLDTKYLRNSIRAKLAQADEETKQKLAAEIAKIKELNQEIDHELGSIFMAYYQKEANVFDRRAFIGLPYSVSAEVLAEWLRSHEIEFDKKQISLLTVNLKTGRNFTKYDIDKRYFFEIDQNRISLRLKSSV